MLDEFKKFAVKGNVVDLAIGVIIGAGFGKIVTSLVDDIIMPAIGFILGRIKFTDYKLQLSDSVSINYGNFLQISFNFLIIAFSMFMVVKVMNRIKDREKKKEEKAAKVEMSKDTELLTEIRDLLKEGRE
ncbi:large-conductance mechanosensitive channel protein MscL [Candidatus Gracilibacteria bacterium]|nr:large-conductance mechanosensitive channel protein MscL [Candidatus Gracilibacteria bacterium]